MFGVSPGRNGILLGGMAELFSSQYCHSFCRGSTGSLPRSRGKECSMHDCFGESQVGIIRVGLLNSLLILNIVTVLQRWHLL